MRPDEHKKKRSAQYKKQHGISQKPKQGQDKKEDRKHKTYPVQKDEDTATNLKKKTVSEHTRQDTKDVSSEDLGSRKSFGRRQIESNWSRYEDCLTQEEEIPSQRGDDFQKLLASAGGSLAQLRLKDEEGWLDDDQKPGITGADNEAGDYVNLDLETISSALNCLPLHQRLDLTDNIFTESQLNEMRCKAHACMSEYRQHHPVSDVYTTQKNTSVLDNETKSDNNKTDLLLSSHEQNTESESDSFRRSDCRSVPLTHDPCYTESASVSVSQTNSVIKQSSVLNMGNLEDDLDFLLSLDNPSKNSAQIKTGTDNMDKIRETKKQSESSTRKPDVKEITKGDVSATDDLDWLDSMLES